MEDNNIHTSVVIELANPKGEPEEQKSYQIDIDDMNVPKDYVIDQIFCGENVTVYALFEVPENEYKNSEKNFKKASSSNIDNDNSFFNKNSYKKVTNERKFNGNKQNSSKISSEENVKFFSGTNSRNKSLYCLKHPSGNYDLLAPERKKSDLKVLYSKNFSLEKSKSTKFKAISVGVNTDIVQSPRIIEEVQKVLGVKVPLLKFKEKITETTNSSSMPSCNVTEVEMQPSFSSLATTTESKNCTGNSTSNYFFVPLFMMDDDNLRKFSTDDNQKNLEKKKQLKSRSFVSKISLGINTDENEFDINVELNKKREQNTQDILHFENSENVSQLPETQQADQNLGQKLKPKERRTILEEIKIMQLKLSALIKNIESSDFESDTKDCDLTESESKTLSETTGNLENKEKFLHSTLESFERNKENVDEHSIFLPWNYQDIDHKTPISDIKEGTEDPRGVKNDEIPISRIDSVFINVVPDEELLVSETDKGGARLGSKETSCYCKISWKSSGNSKSSVLSKSEMNLLYNIEHNCLKKCLSLDFRNIKTEVFKNIKNYSCIQEGSLKTNVKGRILQNNEVYSGDTESLMKCEIGDDANKKLSSKINLISSSQENKKGSISSFNEIDSDVKKNHEEEGDAKFDKAKKNQLSTIFAKAEEKPHAAVTASDGILSPKKSLCSCRKKSKPPDKTTEPEKKTCSDSEKPSTPNGNFRKIITTNSNMKKDLKLIKKTINRHKVVEKTIKSEIPFKKIITGSRKSTKINAESKLHIDKLIKADGLSNHKVSHLFKNNNDEKPVAKGDRNHRPSSQKLEFKENSPEILNRLNKETEKKCLKKKSASSVQVDTFDKKSCSPKTKVELVAGFENVEESASQITSQSHDPSSSDSTSVVVQLLSKKPESVKDFYPKLSQERVNFEKIPSKTNGTHSNRSIKNSRAQAEANKNLDSMEKSIVKSVWALTKVLLFEDGTKKLEVLEASLTPPGYSLNQSVTTPK